MVSSGEKFSILFAFLLILCWITSHVWVFASQKWPITCIYLLPFEKHHQNHNTIEHNSYIKICFNKTFQICVSCRSATTFRYPLLPECNTQPRIILLLYDTFLLLSMIVRLKLWHKCSLNLTLKRGFVTLTIC